MGPRVPLALALVCVAGAGLRFATLDGQSLWFDEAVTASLLQMDFGAMLDAIGDSESTPPLYYVLAWLWTKLAGTGEVGLRSLSALLGTATIPVVWALARRLGGGRAALVAGALIAANPLLVWFSQEARAYALLALLCTLSALLWLRALEAPRGGRLLAWSAVAALALATHYFAVFLVAPQALWLVRHVPGWQARAGALALPVLTGAALLPLALEQRSNEGAAFIGQSPMYVRLAQVPKQFLVGYDAPLEGLLAAAAALAMLAAIAGLVILLSGLGSDATAAARTQTARLTALATVAFLLPLGAATLGEDHFIARNILAALALVTVLGGVGFASAWSLAPRLARAAVTAACAFGLVAVVGVASEPTMQRDNWRGAVRALGPIDDVRVVSAPNGALVPLRYYLPHVHPTDQPQVRTAEIDYLALAPRVSGRADGRSKPPRPRTPPRPTPRFKLADRTFAETFTVLRLQAPGQETVPAANVARDLRGGTAQVLVVTGP
ncbi:MAG: glycosyltransferase family 39 protein [Actinomycetota bacterium]|nr:glycosyltransferase family 39 protein [Actinomycetota bacterium]